MNSIERILYPEREQQERAQASQHQQAVEAVQRCATFFLLDLSEDDVENVLRKTGEKTWLEDGKRK